MRIYRTNTAAARTLVISLALVVAVFITIAFAAPASARCLAVRWSSLDEIADDVYVDPAMTLSSRQALLTTIAEAKERVATRYGEYTAQPVIIAGSTYELVKTYGGSKLPDSPGLSRITLMGTHIVLGPSGFNVDVMAHELAHAELVARIGYWNWRKLPSWFDEGLAVQFDDRYPSMMPSSSSQHRTTVRDLERLGRIRGDDRLAYSLSKLEVRDWLDTIGKAGFFAFLQAMRDGSSFSDAYRQGK